MIAASARQHGVAALAVTMLLFFVMVLGIAFVNRNLVFEQLITGSQACPGGGTAPVAGVVGAIDPDLSTVQHQP